MNENEQTETVETKKEESKFRLRNIISDEDALFLRERSEEVKKNADGFFPPDVRELIVALRGYVVEHNGLGMAAIQLGVKQRVFVMRKPWNSDNLVAIINPRVLRATGMSKKAEGCFSIPSPQGVVALVKRPSMIWVDYIAETGKPVIEEMLVGMDARVFQHELDHLDGMMMVDQDLPRSSGFVRWVRA